MHRHIKNEKEFYVGINRAIEDGRHVEYLQEVLKKYDAYKKVFAANFTKSRPTTFVHRFRAKYRHQHKLWRDIEILGTQTFEDLAVAIIAAMGWDNDHMHGFEFSDYPKTPDPLFTGSSIAFYADGWEDDPHPTYKTNQIRIGDIDYTKQPILNFIFDFGDGHEFSIELENVKERGREKAEKFPRLVDQRGVAPEQYPSLE